MRSGFGNWLGLGLHSGLRGWLFGWLDFGLLGSGGFLRLGSRNVVGFFEGHWFAYTHSARFENTPRA